MPRKIPPRLHVLLARESHKAVVIRRGPSKHMCTIGWDRSNDQFEQGQWLKGRIYERRSDLSPDGKHLIYFAMNGRRDSDSKGSWTTISRAPFLKAIGFWPKGDCWNGGGLFVDSKTFWIDDGNGHETAMAPKNLNRIHAIKVANRFGGCPRVYYPRLMRDGWRYIEQRRVSRDDIDVFDKSLAGGWILRKLAYGTIHHPPGKGCYYDEHQLLSPESSEPLDRKDWEWADSDERRLYWCCNGCLYAMPLYGSGPQFDGAAPVRDFNDMTFEETQAPY